MDLLQGSPGLDADQYTPWAFEDHCVPRPQRGSRYGLMFGVQKSICGHEMSNILVRDVLFSLLQSGYNC